MSEKNECIRNKKVVRGNDFDNGKEVLELFAGKELEDRFEGRKGWYLVKGEKKVVCLLRESEAKKGWRNYLEHGPETDDRGWLEVVSFQSINEGNHRKSGWFYDSMLDYGNNSGFEFYVFVAMEREGVKWYKFAGVFEFDYGTTYYDGGEPASPFDPRSRSNSPFDGRYATFFRRISGEGSLADLCA